MVAGVSTGGSVADCCRASARLKDAKFCDECGKPLLRCMAHEECGGLVRDDGWCRQCVSPELFLDSGAVNEVKVGGALALPLVFRNSASVGRPLFITKLWVREGEGERREQELAWERLDAGAQIPWSVQTSPLNNSGRHRFEVSFVASTRYRWREEAFTFAAELNIDVEQGGAITITQNITAGDTGTAYAPIRLETGGEAQRNAGTSSVSQLALVRAERYDRVGELRGYPGGDRVSRGARIIWRGWPEGEAPFDGPITATDGLVTLGRARTHAQGGENDARLLVRSPGGAMDEALTQAISRRHIDLFIQKGRLYVHAAGEAGVRIDDRSVPRDGIEPLLSGEVLDVLPRQPGALSVRVQMKAHFGEISEVVLSLAPPAA
ncbi:hypothetical protein GC169_02690 [bacterium]|nr:hypothetical protein [bacterium]